MNLKSCLFILISLISVFLIYSLKTNSFKVVFLDVGQGDAILIKLPNDKNILIDGGPNRKIIYQLSKFLNYGENINYIILTHPHEDHYMGLLEILERFKVEKFFWTGEISESLAFKSLLEYIEKKEIPAIKVSAQDKISLATNCDLNFLWPFKKNLRTNSYNINSLSLVFKMNCQNSSWLFTGDIEKEVESKLVESYDNLKVQVLKLPHHGANTSSSLNFLKKIKPNIGIISVGENNFDHPAQEVLKRLESLKIKVFSTLEDGNISIDREID